jgi:hypothetical protein
MVKPASIATKSLTSPVRAARRSRTMGAARRVFLLHNSCGELPIQPSDAPNNSRSSNYNSASPDRIPFGE